MKLLNWLFLLLALAAGFSFRPLLTPQEDPEALLARGWKRLATHRIDFSQDRTEIEIPRNDGRLYTDLRLHVRKGGLVLTRIVVHHIGGEVTNLDAPHVFQPGTRKLVVGLPGPARPITRVVLWYAKPPIGEEKTVLEIWGKQSGGQVARAEDRR